MKSLTGNIARILYAVPMAIFGVFHLMMGPAMVQAVPAWIPGGVFWVYFTGIALIAAAGSIIIKKMERLASLLLALMLLIFVLTIHLPGMGNPATAQMSIMGALKDLGLVAGALLIAGISEEK